MKKSIFLSLLLSITLSACYVQTVKIDPNIKRSEPRGEEDVEKWEHFFLGGLVPDVQHDALADCSNKGGVAFVETRLTFLNQLVSAVTLGIYSPSTTKVYCIDSQK